MTRLVRIVLVAALGFVGACAPDGDTAGARLACDRSCTQRKSQCVVAATNAAELELCDRRNQRCQSECAP